MSTTQVPGHVDSHEPKHPYHLVDPSPWPLVGAMSAFVLAIGGVLFMHEEGSWVMIAGFVVGNGTLGAGF